MADISFAEFDHVTGKVFHHLLASFPVPVTLNAHSVGLQATYEAASGWDGSGHVPASPDEIHFDSCVHWLAGEGYIRTSSSTIASFEGTVLTLRGLNVVSGVPSSLTAEHYRKD
ncbi:hypothetical protein [Pseudomonas sp.]|uniref:hypothetical protein n=1 Tax=Pseudomonas sp. TaxID=306 RepID=UPI002FC867C8